MLQREELFGSRQIARRSLGLRCSDRGHHGRTLSKSHRRACSCEVAVHSLAPVVTFNMSRGKQHNSSITVSHWGMGRRSHAFCQLHYGPAQFSPVRPRARAHVQHVSWLSNFQKTSPALTTQSTLNHHDVQADCISFWRTALVCLHSRRESFGAC